MDKKKILITLQNNKDKLQKLGVRNIGLFGSFVKEHQKDNSDLDFVVEFKKGQKNYDNYIELKFFLEELFDKEIDLVTSESIKPELKAEIMESVEYA
ncbi:nucleotidyltransferase family protein [Natranaerobius thermophilus]|uniref:DNA polymerase beta domain protein region n=1 Tax=Natranaerobius thermophilus (strain ATCC BAA-1301 / DSM 18059 / JW/NM-WN-LF) TaxID=457570 RepID=B2A0Z7_NATTJ|nr:nucleotidyltransferase domain-containing protein [Natranaerobius thermophilus]ACB84620.1 DNA polymerase beta domain protein region [Natranaerobius thermophilus JW/NM-WN-LF]